MFIANLEDGSQIIGDSLNIYNVDKPVKDVLFKLTDKQGILLSGFDKYMVLKDMEVIVQYQKSYIKNLTIIAISKDNVYQITQDQQTKQIIQLLNKVDKPYVRVDLGKNGWVKSKPQKLNNNLWMDGVSGKAECRMVKL